MDLYHVFHQRPREIAPGVGQTDISLERVEITRVPLRGLRATLNFVDGRDAEVVPIGNSPMVCGLCQAALPVQGDDLCKSCVEVRDPDLSEVA